MAIGLGRLAGVNLPENLRRPWRAPDVAEFWRRWHATLAAWLHDYLYVPLGRGALPVLVVFLGSAAWHGWAFTKVLGRSGFPLRAWRGLLVWAVLNAVAVAVVHVRARRGAAAQPAPAGLGATWRVVLTAVFVALAWLPLMLPQFNRLRDLGAVYLRLFGLR
jgi:D-alanyl-lipoteichoic acid acyltransferase DltB (MBOAT superfamily)